MTRLKLRSLLKYVKWLWKNTYVPAQIWLEKKMKNAEVCKLYSQSYIFSFLFIVYVFNLSFPVKPAEQETTQYTLFFSQ
jgi:hypothetical protein